MPIAFVTGAAGLIGGEMAARLADAGWGIFALVRNGRDICANDGRAVPVRDWAGQVPAAGEAVIVAGDVARAQCGLSADAAACIAGHADLIVHCAALTAFDAHWADYEAINLHGTANALAIAPAARFLHVSTAYVCGEVDGPVAEAPASTQGPFTNGYERSKAMAEALVSGSGADWAIARPSIVLGDSRTGAIRKFDTIYALFKLLAEGRIGVLPAADHAALNLVPVDHVSDALMAMIGNWDAVRGLETHICAAKGTPIAEFVEAFASVPGLTGPELVAPDAFDLDALPPIQRRLFVRVIQHYESYFRRNPVFALDRLRAASGLRSPLLDQSAFHRMVEHSIRTGFIKPKLDVAAE